MTRRRVRRLAAVAVAALVVLGTAAAPAQQDLAGYDGSNPFVCELQQAGRGTDIPHPEADPLCVEYDKTRQDVTDMTLVEFLSGEPQRFGMAADKCFYFQHDHWRSRVVAGEPATETYSWDGAYFLDRAAGRGGSYAENFTINGQPAPDASPLLPDRYDPYFSTGRGGLIGDMGIAVEPRCVELACTQRVYREAPPPQVAERCAAAARDEPAAGDGGGETTDRDEREDQRGDRAPTGGRGGAARSRDVRFSESRRSPRFTG